MAADGCHRARLIGGTTGAAAVATERLSVLGDDTSKTSC